MVDILVNNAGIGMAGRFLETTPEHWDTILAVNLCGVISGSRAFASQMVDRGQGGTIINVSSASAYLPVRRTIATVVTERKMLTPDVLALTFADPDGGLLPSWTPGGHIDVQLPSGRRRQYSLCGVPGRRIGYRIAVRRLDDGGGGSIEMHETWTRWCRWRRTGSRCGPTTASSLKPRGRSVRPSTCSAGSGSLGPVNIRRAVERPIPVVATTRSRILFLSALDAPRYPVRSLLVTCRLAAMSILPSTTGKP